MNRKKGLLLSYVFTILNTVIGLFTSAYTIQMVGQTEYGVYQAIAAFTSYLVLFELGTGNILNRNISLLKKDGTEQTEINKNFSTIWSITILLSVLILSVAVAFYFSLDTVYRRSLAPEQIVFGKFLFIPTTIKLVVGFWTQTLNGGLIGYEYYSVPKTVALIHLLVRTAIVVLFLSIYRSILLTVVIDAILEIAMFVATFCYARCKLHVKLTTRYFDKGVFMAALPLAIALLFQSVVNMANNSVDKFVISVIMPPEKVAIYSVAMFIFVTFSSLTSLPTSMYMPEVASNVRKGLSGRELTETLVQPCRLVVVIGGVIIGGFVVVGRPFISLMYGPEYIDAWLIAVVVMVPMLINTTNGIVINILDILNKRLIRSVILLGVALLNIVLTVWWVQHWGMIGAAVATAVSTVIGLTATNIYYTKALGVQNFYLFIQSYRGILPCLIIATLLALGVTYPIKDEWLDFIVGGIVFVFAFLGAFFVFGANRTEKEILQNRLLKQ